MKYMLLAVVSIYFSVGLKAQGLTNCLNALQMCGTTTFSIHPFAATAFTNALPISNPTSNPQLVNSGCAQGGGNSAFWFRFTIAVGGSLGFSIGDSLSGNPQAGFYDWNLWIDSTNTCNNIYADAHAPVACNWNAAAWAGTGMGAIPANAVAGNYQPSIPVSSGQSFILMVSNFSGVNALVTFTSTGTAIIGCVTEVNVSAFKNSTQFYYNPSSHTMECFLENYEGAVLNLHSVEGKEVIKNHIAARQTSIDISKLPPGIYIAELNSAEGKQIKKVIIY